MVKLLRAELARPLASDEAIQLLIPERCRYPYYYIPTTYS